MEEMAAILQAQRRAFDVDLPVSAKIRKDRLKRAIALMIENRVAIVEAVSGDFGHRSAEQSMMSDVMSVVLQLKHCLMNLDRWMKPEKRKLALPMMLMGARAWVEFQPKGVVGVIAPWNFPVQLSMGPVAAALAAGNRAMVKNSEITPRVSALFEEMGPRYFEQNELAFFSGDADAGRTFSSLPFDHLIFTGATNIARHVLRAAADHLVPVTLELGGKSPTIIGRGADIISASGKIALGKMMNAGQICVAPDYLLVPDDREVELIDSLKATVAQMYPSLLDNPDYTSVVNERHHVRLRGYLEDARTKGAEVIEINPAGEDFATSNGTKMPLYIVRGATDEMQVMQEEIFGPILPVLRYAGIDQAIGYVNAHPRPLALYYFGSDITEQRRVLDRTISGGVTLNDVVFHAGIEELPFGGVGPSGMGAYHGIDGFKTFSHGKAIYKQAWVDIAKLGGMKPPYGKATRATLDRALGRKLKKRDAL